jgi:hypothetical protein
VTIGVVCEAKRLPLHRAGKTLLRTAIDALAVLR